MSDDLLLALARRRGLVPADAVVTGDAQAVLRAHGLEADLIAQLEADLALAAQPPQIPGYAITGHLGDGASSIVYRAVQEGVGREVALKVIPARRARDEERFLREAAAAGAIGHRHVVTCHEAGVVQGRLFLALELLTGGDAAALATRLGGRLPPERALAICRDAALGLQALADAGLVHRDIKPANLLLDDQGRAKLGDLGLATAGLGSLNASRSTMLEGTPAFMAPEQARGEATTARSDIFSLGATCFALVAGRTPFSGDTPIAMLRAIAEGQRPDLAEHAPEAPLGLREILRVALDRDPARRYPRADQLAADFEAVRTGQPPLHARRLREAAANVARPGQIPVTTSSPSLWVMSVVAGLILGLAWGWWSRPSHPLRSPWVKDAEIMGTVDAWRHVAHSGTEAEAQLARWAIAILERNRQHAAPSGEHAALQKRLDSAVSTHLATLQARRTAPATEPSTGTDTAVAESMTAAVTAMPDVTSVTVPVEMGVPQAEPSPLPTAPPMAHAFSSQHVNEYVQQAMVAAHTNAHWSQDLGSEVLGLTAPHPTTTCLAWTRAGMVFGTSDQGRTWTPWWRPAAGWNPQYAALGQVSADGHTFFLPCSGQASGVLVSLVGVGGWREYPDRVSTTPDDEVVACALHADNSIVVVRRVAALGLVGHCVQVTPNGRTFTTVTSFIQGWRALLPLPGGRLLLLAGTHNATGLRASLDLGQTWTHISNAVPAGSIVPQALRCGQGLRVPIRQGALMLSVDARGLPLTTQPIDQRMCAQDGSGPFVAWCEDPRDQSLLAVGALTGAMRSTDGGATWRARVAPIAMPTAIAAVRNGALVMASGQRVLWLDQDQGSQPFNLDYEDARMAQSLIPILPPPP